jgi:hypothetical protein
VALRPVRGVAVTVLDWRGVPLENATATASGLEERKDGFGRTFRVAIRLATATTDARGVARLDLPLGPNPESLTVWRPRGRHDVLPNSAGWDGSETTVRMRRAYEVRGSIVDTGGRPLPRARLAMLVASRWVEEPVSSDATFEIHDLLGDPVTLRAALEGAPLDDTAATVAVPAGSDDVRIAVDTSGELIVRFENWKSSYTRRALLTRETTASEGPALPMRVDVTSEGTARFLGLQPGTAYVLWSPPDDEGLTAYRAGIRVGESPLSVPLRTGRDIRVRWSPGDVTDVEVFATGPGLPGLTMHDGVIAGLPDGRWRLTAIADTGTAILRGTADADAGGSVEIELTPAPSR